MMLVRKQVKWLKILSIFIKKVEKTSAKKENNQKVSDELKKFKKKTKMCYGIMDNTSNIKENIKRVEGEETDRGIVEKV